MITLLLVEDDADFAAGLSKLLSRAGYYVHHERTVAGARVVAARSSVRVALVDLQLPDGDGLALIGELAQVAPGLKSICLTGRNDAGTALRAIRAGAADYLTKPVNRDDLLRAVANVLGGGPSVPAGELQEVRVEAEGPVGTSSAWRRLMELVAAVAKAQRTSVLITGEPGVGKEVAASLVHRLSRRASGPFVATNAACLSPGLVESELFGHEAGAFTGAQKRRRGLFELAAGGTLFIDEIGELPLELQAKLLRVLEGQPFRRLGGEAELVPDVRLVCATNRDLARLVREGRFRADLHDRLRVFEVAVPPLRERREDIPLLAEAFARKLSSVQGMAACGLTAAARERLLAHDWPGNARELRNVIERALVLADGAAIGPEHLPGLGPAPAATPPPSARLEDVVRAHVIQTYRACGENLTRAAEQLDISRLQLRRRLRAYGLKAAAEPGDELELVGDEPAPVRNEPAREPSASPLRGSVEASPLK